MRDRKRVKVCPGCGEAKRIRTDRTFCSVACAARNRAEVGKISKTLIFGDVHFPQHDKKFVDLILRWAADERPDRVILNGDILDCYPISRWAQPGSPGPGLGHEIALGRKFLGDLRTAIGPAARIDYLEGNHEFRFRAYLANQAAALHDLDHNVSIPGQLHLDAFGVNYHECPGNRWFSTYIEAAPDLLVGHFAKTSVNAGYAAKNLLDQYGVSLITGHGHCAGSSHKTLHGRQVFAYEGGCGCDLHPPYCEPKHWAHAFHVAHTEPDAPTVVDRVIINEGRFVYSGRLYK